MTFLMQKFPWLSSAFLSNIFSRKHAKPLAETYNYPNLLGESAWQRLHPAIRQRFDTREHEAVTYTGEMDEVYLSFFGKIFAQVCRLIGTPLALHNESNVPMIVNVFLDNKRQGMTWERIYHYQNHAKNTVCSTKVIAKDGLAEMIGFGFGMKLNVTEKNSAVVFTSDYYFLQIANFKMRIPNLFTPGKTTVTQTAITEKKFEFRLHVEHPVFGEVFRQVGVFYEKLEQN